MNKWTKKVNWRKESDQPGEIGEHISIESEHMSIESEQMSIGSEQNIQFKLLLGEVVCVSHNALEDPVGVVHLFLRN